MKPEMNKFKFINRKSKIMIQINKFKIRQMIMKKKKMKLFKNI